MSPTQRQIAVVASVLYLTALTALAGYAAHSSNRYSLPIPNALAALTLALPPLAGITMETSNSLAAALSSSPKWARQYRFSTIPPVLLPSTLTIVGLIIYATIVATLAGTHLTPIGGLACALTDRWNKLFRTKAADDVRRIQDAFQCCGLRNAHDMAYPFPDREHGADACVVRFERNVGCFGAWRDEERLVSGLMLGVAIGVFLWMIIIVATPAFHPPHVRRGTLQLPWPGASDDDDDTDTEANDHSNHAARAIQAGRYRDDPDADDEETADEDHADETSMRREIRTLNSQSNLASRIEGGHRRHPSALIDDANKWREPNGA